MTRHYRLALLLCALALAPLAHATTVRIHYQTAGGQHIAVRSDKGAASWDKGAAATKADSQVWTYTWPDAQGPVQMKPALDDEHVSIGGTYTIAVGATADIYPFFGAPFGKVSITEPLASPQLGNSRRLRIYLPPSYEENRAKRYPVLYMHDGQNLFDAKTAAYGAEWGIDETANHLIATGAIDEIIVVGIDNTPERIAEYTPCCDPREGGGKLDGYRDFIVDTVKPLIDRTLRTQPEAAHTAIMGSSLGGIASLVIGQQRAQVFSMAGVVSGSFWWNRQALVREQVARSPLRLYLDAGTSNDGIADTRLMRSALLARGYVEGSDLLYVEAAGASHNEKSWAARVDKPLRWFFGWNGR